MDKYNPESVHKRVDYVQYIYKNIIYPAAFENFIYPIAVYDLEGTIAAANRAFRKLVGIEADDVQNSAVNLFDHLDEKNAGLVAVVRNAFDNKESVYEGTGCLIKAEGKPAMYELSRYPNAMAFPVVRDGAGVLLAGILLDEKKSDDTD